MSNSDNEPKANPTPGPKINPTTTIAPNPAPFRHALGGIKEEMVQAFTIPAVNFKTVLKDLPGNPFIYQRRVAQNFLAPDTKVTVTQNLVNTLSGKPATTNVANEIKDVSTEEESK